MNDGQSANESPEATQGNQPSLGMTADVTFPAFGNRALQGKVDTGATTSSLHASDIKVGQGRVQFTCKELSDNVITLELDGSQEVHSADAGGNTRPVVTLDITINGTAITGASFNLNDRSNMDMPVLLGQNVLKAGNFIINPNDDGTTDVPDNEDTIQPTRESIVMKAVEVLAEQDVSLQELISYLQLSAINRIKE
jgi:hypothetical protein